MTDLDVDTLAGLPLDQLLSTLKAAVELRRGNRIDFFEPYPKQIEFIRLGLTRKQRLLTAGNRMGKSEVGAYETACHLTGLYPPDWPGFKYDHPIRAWAAGESTEIVRNVSQTKLCGSYSVEDDFGTGFIPKHCFVAKPKRAPGNVSDAYDTVQVHHYNADGLRDGVSTLQFKSYEQGRTKFQGDNIHFIWWDEEPEEKVHTEGEARWSSEPDGRSIMTFTPLRGMSDVVLKFLGPSATGSKLRGSVRMGFKDCSHMTPELIEMQLEKYPKYEHDARMEGIPLLGEGRIFLTDPNKIVFSVEQMIPDHWPKLVGIDFGISHPFGAALAAWDRDNDIVYVLWTYRAAETLPVIHAEAIRAVAADVPIAWPLDGHPREKSTGESLAAVYKTLGLKMLPSHAKWPDGSISTEACVLDAQQRFAEGRLRIREDLGDLLEEYKMYHRKDGMIVKLHDDILSAVYKILMAKRHARCVGLGWTERQLRLKGKRPTGRILDPFTGKATLTYR